MCCFQCSHGDLFQAFLHAHLKILIIQVDGKPSIVCQRVGPPTLYANRRSDECFRTRSCLCPSCHPEPPPPSSGSCSPAKARRVQGRCYQGDNGMDVKHVMAQSEGVAPPTATSLLPVPSLHIAHEHVNGCVRQYCDSHILKLQTCP